MNEKIYRVVAKMCETPADIQNIDVSDNGEEYYFEFPTGTFWSVGSYKGDYTLYLYPRFQGVTSDLKNSEFKPGYANSVAFISYSASEVGDNRFTNLVSNLYKVIQSRFLGADEILDKILGDDPLF